MACLPHEVLRIFYTDWLTMTVMIYDGVTRATRVATLLPGTRVRPEVIGALTSSYGHLLTVGAHVP